MRHFIIILCMFLSSNCSDRTNRDDSPIRKLLEIAKCGTGIVVPGPFCAKLVPELELLIASQTENKLLKQRLEIAEKLLTVKKELPQPENSSRLPIRLPAFLKED